VKQLVGAGVIEACLEPGALMAAVLEIAREIVANSPIAVIKAKRSFNAVEEMPFRDGYRLEQGVTVELSRTDDAREAQRAFLEKREPRFTGR
jgi:enoyl-CoA hydratase